MNGEPLLGFLKIVLTRENIKINQISINDRLTQIKTENGCIRIYHTKKGDKLDLSQYKGNTLIFLICSQIASH